MTDLGLTTDVQPDLDEINEGWANHDVERIMKHIHEDCVWMTSFGPELDGQRFDGADEVRQGLEMYFQRYPTGAFSEFTIFFAAGNQLACTWVFTATVDGEERSQRGCDLVTFANDGRVLLKNAFRKERI